MSQNGQHLSPFRSGVRAYLIGALIAIALTVLLSLRMPMFPLPFAFRLTILLGGIPAYFGYKNALIRQRMRETDRPADKSTPGGWRTPVLLALVVIVGSSLLVFVTGAIFNQITGGAHIDPWLER
jgi:hypothetical protein